MFWLEVISINYYKLTSTNGKLVKRYRFTGLQLVNNETYLNECVLSELEFQLSFVSGTHTMH